VMPQPATTSMCQPNSWNMPPGAVAMMNKSNPSPKRAYGQVQRIADDQWRCPDGKTFPRAYLAYRHLKELKEKNPNLLSPYKSPRTSTAERRAMQQRVVSSVYGTALLSPGMQDNVDAMSLSGGEHGEPHRCAVTLYGSCVDAEVFSGSTSLYYASRLWRRNDPYGRQKTAFPKEEAGNAVELPPPLPHTTDSMAQDYRGDNQEPAQDLDTVIMSTPDTPPELLLKTHITFARAIRNWWQKRRVHRISRFRPGRMDLILPDGPKEGEEMSDMEMNEETEESEEV